MDITSTSLNAISDYPVQDSIDNEVQKRLQESTTKSSQDPQSQPTANTNKAAQSSNDIVISSGKTVGQVVMEHSAPNKLNENRTTSEGRDLGVSITESAIGTQADKNALSAEINSKTNR